jgi:hypothetical protein
MREFFCEEGVDPPVNVQAFLAESMLVDGLHYVRRFPASALHRIFVRHSQGEHHRRVKMLNLSSITENKKTELTSGSMTANADQGLPVGSVENSITVNGNSVNAGEESRYSLKDEDYDRLINETMTMQQAKRLIEATFNAHDIREMGDY